MILITNDSFKGFHSISQNSYSRGDLTLYINKYEKAYYYRLLGQELAELFIADLDPVTKTPITQRFIDIYEPFCKTITDSCSGEGEFIESFGMVDLSLGFVYFHFVGDQPYKNTVTGQIKNENSKSTVLDTNDLLLSVEKRFNQSVISYKAIQKHIEENAVNYPEFAGVDINPKFINIL